MCNSNHSFGCIILLLCILFNYILVAKIAQVAIMNFVATDYLIATIYSVCVKCIIPTIYFMQVKCGCNNGTCKP